MSRIPLLSAEQLAARGIDVAPILGQFDEVPGSVATLGHRPDILAQVLGLWQAVMGPGLVDRELKFLAAYLASMAAGCRYCSAHTASLADTLGSSERVEAVWEFETSHLFDERERSALRFCMMAGATPSEVTDDAVQEVIGHWGAEAVVELLAVSAVYGFFNRWNDALAMPLEQYPRSFAEAKLGEHGWEIGKHG